MSGHLAAIERLAAMLQRLECASTRGQRIVGTFDSRVRDFHRGAANAYGYALELLLHEFPHAFGAALRILDNDRDSALRADYRERLTALGAKLSNQPVDADTWLPSAEPFDHSEVADLTLQCHEPVAGIARDDKGRVHGGAPEADQPGCCHAATPAGPQRSEQSA